MKQLYIDYHPRRSVVALLEDGELAEFYYERSQAQKIVGNIYKGKVESAFKGMKAAFVNIGLERNAFLSVDEALFDKSEVSETFMPPQNRPLSPGDVIMCQVIKDQFGSKGARVTRNVAIPGRTLVLVPGVSSVGISRKIASEHRRAELEKLIKAHCPDNMGFIVRTMAEKTEDDEILAEMSALMASWKEIRAAYRAAPEKSVVKVEPGLIARMLRDCLSDDVERVVVNDRELYLQVKDYIKNLGLNPGILELYSGEQYFLTYFELAKKCYQVLNRRVELENGAYLIFDRTEALSVIDVNTGRYTGQTDLEDTVYKTNLLAAEEIARQIRLRNLGGIILVDFIDMKEESHRADVLKKLEEGLKKDRIRASIAGMTNLGLVEITRKRERSMADEVFLTDCPYCKGAGRIYIDELVILRIRERLLEFFNCGKSSEAYVFAHPEIVEKIVTLDYFEHDLNGHFKDKVIHLVSDASRIGDCFDVAEKNIEGAGASGRFRGAKATTLMIFNR
ncbi:MAG TPA: Rne/Rng family ribonuclease [Clostridia bacterium]|nr:Rne/Rng family ribonuclease [Clostridia bacterium]